MTAMEAAVVDCCCELPDSNFMVPVLFSYHTETDRKQWKMVVRNVKYERAKTLVESLK